MDNASCIPGDHWPNIRANFQWEMPDRSVTSAIEDAWNLEFVKCLATRPTQGLIICLKDSIFLKPEMNRR